MTDDETILADQALADVMGMYNHTLTQFEARIWAAIMSGVTLKAFQAFLQQHTLTNKFAPKPSDATAALALRGSDPQVAYAMLEQAVSTTGPYRMPAFTDEVLVAAIHQMGGWAAVNEQMPKADAIDTFSVKAFKDRFDTAYRMAISSVCIQGEKPLPLLALGMSKAPSSNLMLAKTEQAPAVPSLPRFRQRG